VGLTISTAIFPHYLKTKLLSAFSGKANGNTLVASLRTDFNALQSMDPAQKVLGQEAYMTALYFVFWLTTAESLVSGIASPVITENEISERSGNQ